MAVQIALTHGIDEYQFVNHCTDVTNRLLLHATNSLTLSKSEQSMHSKYAPQQRFDLKLNCAESSNILQVLISELNSYADKQVIFLRDLVADPQVQLAANADKQLKEDCVVVESLGSGSVEHAHAQSKKRKFKDYVQELQDEYLPASCESVDSDE